MRFNKGTKQVHREGDSLRLSALTVEHRASLYRGSLSVNASCLLLSPSAVELPQFSDWSLWIARFWSESLGGGLFSCSSDLTKISESRYRHTQNTHTHWCRQTENLLLCINLCRTPLLEDPIPPLLRPPPPSIFQSIFKCELFGNWVSGDSRERAERIASTCRIR